MWLLYKYLFVWKKYLHKLIFFCTLGYRFFAAASFMYYRVYWPPVIKRDLMIDAATFFIPDLVNYCDKTWSLKVPPIFCFQCFQSFNFKDRDAPSLGKHHGLIPNQWQLRMSIAHKSCLSLSKPFGLFDVVSDYRLQRMRVWQLSSKHLLGVAGIGGIVVGITGDRTKGALVRLKGVVSRDFVACKCV